MIETPKSKQLGAALYSARQAKGWSVGEVAERIGASVSLVASLERDAGAELAPVYRDGFLRRYLHLVGMDEEVAPTAPPPAIRPILTGVRGIRKNHWINASFSWLRYALVSVVIVAPMLWFGINHSVLWLTDGLEATPEGSERAAKANSERRQVRIIRASQLPPRGQSQSQPQPQSQPQSLMQPQSSNQQPEANALGSQPGRGAGDTPQPPANMSPVAQPVAHELTIRLTEDSWIEVVDAEDSRLEHNLLRGDTAQRYQGEPPFDLLLGKGAAVELALNGQVVNHLAVQDEPSGSVGLIELRVFADGRVERKP